MLGGELAASSGQCSSYSWGPILSVVRKWDSEARTDA